MEVNEPVLVASDDSSVEASGKATSDLNAIALGHLKDFLKQESELSPKWKAAITQLLESGIPQDLTALTNLMDEVENNGDKKAEG